MPGQRFQSIQNGLTRTWAQLSAGQRRALVILVSSNLVIIAALLTLLLRSPTPLAQQPTTAPLSPQRLAACREQISRTILKAGYTGLVQTEPDGTIWLQLQWPNVAPLGKTPGARSSNPPVPARSRLDADAAVWAALEVAAHAGREGCLGFQVLQVTVHFPEVCAPTVLAPSEGTKGCQARRATARVRLPDLLMWSMGKLDDAELSLRVDYVPPAQPLTPTPNK